MQFGIFTVSDITRDPTTGKTPSEAERIDATVQIAKKAEEVGLEVFGSGEHHNPPSFSSRPTNSDPAKSPEDYEALQHLPKGDVLRRHARATPARVHPWLGQATTRALP